MAVDELVSEAHAVRLIDEFSAGVRVLFPIKSRYFARTSCKVLQATGGRCSSNQHLNVNIETPVAAVLCIPE